MTLQGAVDLESPDLKTISNWFFGRDGPGAGDAKGVAGDAVEFDLWPVEKDLGRVEPKGFKGEHIEGVFDLVPGCVGADQSPGILEVGLA